MPSSDSGEKSEKATPKRKRDERKKGNIFKSEDLVASFSILFIFLTIKFCGDFMYAQMSQCIIYWINISAEYTALTRDTMNDIIVKSIKTIVFVGGPIFIVGTVAPILLTGAQTRFLFSKDALKPKFSRINPISGFKRLFSLRSVVELIKNLLKIAVISGIIYSQLKKRINQIVSLFNVDVKAAFVYLCSGIFSIILTICIVFVFMGIADFAYQWWEYERNLRMTKQEIKEEYKQMEGDPQIKGAIKQRQRAMAQKRMMQEVPKADVIIRNPTHFAVAIKYDPDKNRAPVVVAKGMDQVALRIVKIAEENNIYMQENKPLARGLYDAVDIGREIPEEFYKPVAEILAFVYDLKQKSLGMTRYIN